MKEIDPDIKLVKLKQKKTKKTLVIVESPGKISKIQSYLGSNYVVKASYGHILAVNPRGISIDLKKFEPEYVSCPDKKEVIRNIKAEYKKAGDLLIATDLDREGEMIAWSIAHILNLKNPKRIAFNDITKKSIMDAVSKPSVINQNMVNAQKCRTMLDKIIGYDLSGLIRSNINNAKSAGRVQSVVVRLIIDKENEIKNFIDTGLESDFKTKGYFDTLAATLYSKNNIKKMTLKEVEPFYKLAVNATYKITDIFDKPKSIKPQQPFTTATLQQEASKRYKFSAKNTMQIAQKLYEEGLITYMRTDSVNLSDEALLNIKEFILETYGKEYYEYRQYQNKGNSQEAHEAVRVTDPKIVSVLEDGKIGPNEIKLYSLIWKRTIASQLKAAEFLVLNVHISISNIPTCYFLSQAEKCVFKGFMIVSDNTIDSDTSSDTPSDTKEIDTLIKDNGTLIKDIGTLAKDIKIGDILTITKITTQENFKEPPSRYNEASLINKLDIKNLNIGRPSTYASILNKITDRNYVKTANIDGIEKDVLTFTWFKGVLAKENKKVLVGKETNKLVPTELGISVTSYLVDKFLNIVEYKFTADMEKCLDGIANGSVDWFDYMTNFYKEFEPHVKKNRLAFANNDADLVGQDLLHYYYRCSTKYGPAIKKVCINDPKVITYTSIKAPYTLENITFENVLEICKYPYVLGSYENHDIIIKDGYFTWNDRNYTGSGLTLEDCTNIISSKNEITLSDDNNIYCIKTGPHGKYLNVCNKKKLEAQKKKKSINYKVVYTNYKIYPAHQNLETYSLDLVKEIVKNHNIVNKKPKPKK